MQGQINTPYGVFGLGVHTGLGIGRVKWEIIGTPEWRTFFFHGTAVESCTTTAQCAQTEEIIAAAPLVGRSRPRGTVAGSAAAQWVAIGGLAAPFLYHKAIP